MRLRSFEGEYKGSSDEEIERINLSAIDMQQMYTEMSTSMGGGACFLPSDAFKTKNIWTVQKGAIEAIQKHLQTVLLENVNLSESKRAELEEVHALLVPVVSDDWWRVFIRLANKATIMVFFLQVISPTLRREMDYAFTSQRRYIVICRDDMKDMAIHSQDEVERRLIEGARHVITYHDEDSGADELHKKLSAIPL